MEGGWFKPRRTLGLVALLRVLPQPRGSPGLAATKDLTLLVSHSRNTGDEFWKLCCNRTEEAVPDEQALVTRRGRNGEGEEERNRRPRHISCLCLLKRVNRRSTDQGRPVRRSGGPGGVSYE